MNKNGPIIVIEDDADDQEIIQGVFERLNYKNEVLFFFDPEKALDYINQAFVSPFLILSDINMPKLSGMELKKKISTDAALQVKCIPYLFFHHFSQQGRCNRSVQHVCAGLFYQRKY